MTSRAYKRSWKNLLINTQYQLSFTLIMVGLAAVLMGLLGWWVVRVASEATTVAKSSIRGKPCVPSPAALVAAAEPVAPAPAAVPVPDPAAVPVPDPAAVPVPAPDPAAVPAPDPAAVPVPDPAAVPVPDADADTDDNPRRRVTIGASSMTIEEPVAPPPAPIDPVYAQQVAAHWECELGIASDLAAADRQFKTIVFVMIGSSILLILGLAVMGIKMTHKVAGPLYKVTLYLAKMRDGRYDKVYDLRKGDQLVEFYEHFKHAHAGVVKVEQADVARIRAALDAATASGAIERSPELAAAADELRAVLARKEKSFG